MLLKKSISFTVYASLSWLFFLSFTWKIGILGKYLEIEPRMAKDGIQGSVLGPLLFLLYVEYVFVVFWNGALFLLAYDIKILYTFCTEDLEFSVRHRKSAPLNSCMMDFYAEESSIVGYRCVEPLRVSKLGIRNIPVNCKVSYQDLNNSCTLDFSQQVLAQAAKANKWVVLLHRTVERKQTATFRTRIWPILEYSSLVINDMRKSRNDWECWQPSSTIDVLGILGVTFSWNHLRIYLFQNPGCTFRSPFVRRNFNSRTIEVLARTIIERAFSIFSMQNSGKS